MSISKISPDDPKLTAYALGELAGEERAAVEAALRDDPVARAAVEEIRALGAQLTAALAAEPALEFTKAESDTPRHARAAIISGDDPRKLDGGPLSMGRSLGKLIKFPQLYFVVAGVAAACFAVVVALQPEPKPKMVKAYTELTLAPQAEHQVNLPAVAADAGKLLASSSAAPAAAAPVPVASMDAAEQKLMSFEVKDSRDRLKDSSVTIGADSVRSSDPSGPASYLRANSVAETRIGMEIQKVPQSADVITRGFTDSITTGARSFTYGSDNTKAAGRVRDANRPAGNWSAAEAPNTEGYAYRQESDFLGAAENPLSTFAIDVATASYANLRRFIQGGRLPPPDAVRVEELVNYFPYHDAPPTGDVPFAATMEVADAPWAPTHRLVRIGLKGREVSTAARPAANLVFLLDVSGSMDEPNKLPLVKESMRMLVGKLRPDDRVAIVVYAGASGLALPSTPVKKAAEIIAALEGLTPGGSTNGAMGIQLAYDIAKANFVPGGVNRVILCTDGDFNVGVTSEGDLVRLITEKAKSGVSLTALGFGMGNYKDATIEQLADKGNGNYGYIDSRREAEKLLVEQVNGTLLTIAKDVKLQVEFNPAQVASYRLIGYENRLLKKEDFNNDAVAAGEIGAGHTVTALYEVVPVGAEEKTAPAVDDLKYRMADTGNRKGDSSNNPQSAIRNPQSKELLTLKVRYKQPDGSVSRKLEFPLVDAGARFASASADFKFAAAVAEFGMILRDSPHKGTGTLSDVLAWAGEGTDSDAGGYRGEFAELVRQAEALMR